MPTVTRENISPLNDKITVTVNREDYFPLFEKSLKQYAKQANIPGFRKGMVPAGVIRKMHGPAVFTEEVLRSVEKSLMDYLRQEQLDIFAQPMPADQNDARGINMNEPTDYSFSFEIGLKPGFQLPDLARAKTTRYEVEVTDAMVEEELKKLQQKFGKLSEPDTATSEDNVLNVSFQACDADGTVAEGTPSKENSLLVKYFSAPMRKKLMGAKKDDAFTIQLSEAFDEKEREWVLGDLGLDKNDPASGGQHFRMNIVKLGLVEPRRLDEAFFKEVYPAKEIGTEAAFRDEIRNEIRQYWGNQSRNHLQHELYHVLLEQTQMDFPESFLRKWMMSGGEEPKTPEQVETEFPTFRNQLRWTLVSDRIVQDQQITVAREEIKDQMRQQVMGYFGSMSLDGNFEWLDSYIERMMKDENQVESAYRRIVTEKIFQWAETQVNPELKSISVDDFAAILKEHEHQH
jgi:trigger factor